MEMHKYVGTPRGRSFAIGDLHGCYHLLEKALQHVNFDFEKDHVFSVGDLCDRGPQSAKCIDLINQDWFSATYSNHDEKLYYAGIDKYSRETRGKYGDLWSEEFLNQMFIDEDGDYQAYNSQYDFFADALNKINDLPLCMSTRVWHGDGENSSYKAEVFHFIHAEFSLDMHKMELYDTLITSNKFWHTKTGSSLIWDRTIFSHILMKDFDKEAIDGLNNLPKFVKQGTMNLSNLISGHTIVKRPTRIERQLNIDTGAYLDTEFEWAGLTLYDMNNNVAYLAKSTGVTTNTIIHFKYDPN